MDFLKEIVAHQLAESLRLFESGRIEEFKAAIEGGLKAIEVLLREGPQAAMDQFHRK